ncbi:MAG: class I SAM-dependent methyltransferase [Bacteroidia bacterium]|nr:class I SAM-dependent methyltransferase [Bacteroidia bacterium]
MDKNKETFETWNKIAFIYQEKFMKMDLYNETYNFICDSIAKPQAKLLEIGCGPGNISKYLLSQRTDFDILGIDIAPNMIELAKVNNPSAHFQIMDTREIHTLKSKFDGIIGGFCLPYLSQKESNQLIANSYELLNDNGLIYLSFVEGDPAKSGYKSGSGGRVFFYYHNLVDLKSQLAECDFQEIQVFKVSYPISETEFDIHTILTAKKKNTL